MTQLLALFWLVLALAGCSPQGSTIVERVSADGRDVLHSEIHVVHGLATFQCLASSSGTCHYAVYVNDCAGKTSCTHKLVHQFGVRAGQRLYDTTQPHGFIPCVGVSEDAARQACTQDDRLAATTPTH